MTDDWVDGKQRTLGCPATRRAEAYIADEWRKRRALAPTDDELSALVEDAWNEVEESKGPSLCRTCRDRNYRECPLDCPEGYLWVRRKRRESRVLTVIGRDRLRELHAGAVADNPTEELLAANPEWLRIYLAHCGEVPIEIPEGGPLPSWNEEWLLSVGEGETNAMTDDWVDWEKRSLEYLAARRAAGTPEGIAFAEQLKAMDPSEAADRIERMFVLCATEDLEIYIEQDLELDRTTTALIAAELRKRRGPPPTEEELRAWEEEAARLEAEADSDEIPF